MSDWFGGSGGIDLAKLSITLLDIFVVGFVIYKLLMLIKGTRAWQILWGLGVFFIAVFLSNALHLRALNWLLSVFIPLGPVALVILFFPELRHALEHIGRLKFLGQGFKSLGQEDLTNLIDETTGAVVSMSKSKTGALIVIEREVGLDNVIAGGHKMNAVVTSVLLRTIFHPGSPLHDGAVVIRGNRIVAASCTLPLSDSPRLGMVIHTRHKAALGISEQSDAVVLVVSEESGTISLSQAGSLDRGLTPDQLRDKLAEHLHLNGSREGGLDIRKTVSGAFSRVMPGNSHGRDRK